MEQVIVNNWAVLFCAVASMAVGATWYSPGVFGNKWMKLAKVKEEKNMPAAKMAVMYGGAFLASLITAYVLAHVTYLSHSYFNYDYVQAAITTALWLWLGLTAARFFVHDSFEGRPRQLTLLTVGHEFLTFLVFGLIIGLMGVN